MKNLPLLFCGIFFTLAFSFSGLILSSHIQIGGLERTTETLNDAGEPVEGEPLFPRKEGGSVKRGKQVYIEMGCIYCHSQQVRREGFGADFERGWGDRQSVARDYITQDRVLLGTMRTGPDLADIGGRPLNRDWHLQHLYDPQLTTEDSTMPPFPFLFKKRKIEGEPSENALDVTGSDHAPGPEYEVVPTRRAEALVDYLLSMEVDYSLPEAPVQ
ncbi:MAG: cbb3-type cytochrome c oxidase subunit II [Opitutales bacterium]